jgi:hypothetical protein
MGQALLEVAEATGAKSVVWNRRYEPQHIQLDQQVEVGPEHKSDGSHLFSIFRSATRRYTVLSNSYQTS